MMKPLRNVLRLNATTCIAFGLLFLIAPTAVGTFLGSVPDLVIQIVGFALIFNGGHLIITSRRAQINPSEVYYFAAGDILWFIGSLVILTLGTVITTTPGIIATLVVAVGVGAIGLRQIWVLKA